MGATSPFESLRKRFEAVRKSFGRRFRKRFETRYTSHPTDSLPRVDSPPAGSNRRPDETQSTVRPESIYGPVVDHLQPAGGASTARWRSIYGLTVDPAFEAMEPFESTMTVGLQLASDTLMQADTEAWQAFLAYYGVLSSMADHDAELATAQHASEFEETEAANRPEAGAYQ